MKAGFIAASAALVGSVVASHPAHAGFHLRRGYADNQICTVYTTVYVTASELPPMASNTTVYMVPSPVPETSTPCPEESSSTPIYTPPAPSSSPAVYSSTPCPEESNSTPIYTPPAPSSSSAVYTPPHVPSTSETPVAPSSKSVYSPAPAPSSSSKEAYTPPPVYTPPTSSVAPKPSSSKEAYTPPPVYTPPASSAAPKPSSKYVAPKPKPSKPAAGSGSYGHRITPNGQKWSITYTPYAQNGDCKSASEIQSDISKIADKGYTTIRSYSTDCGVFENVVPACQKHGLKIIYGVFLDAGKGPNSAGANEQLQEIIDNAPKDSMAMLIVGNESIFAHGVQPDDLAAYVKTCKEKLIEAGFPSDIPVTTTEPVGTWEQYGAVLCDVIDVFAVQVHPFFDGGISAGEAGEFAVKQLEQAAKVCPEAAAKGEYITEIGWPKGGEANGAAIPGVSQQKEAMKSIIDAVGDKACIFSFQDDLWKEPGAFGVEREFGCLDILP